MRLGQGALRCCGLPLLVLCLFGAGPGQVQAVRVLGGRMTPPPLEDESFAHRSRLGKRSAGTGVFDQLISHDDPSLGTFKQQFWWSDEYHQGPGSPVVFFTPGEASAKRYTAYLRNRTLPGMLAQAVGGAGVMLEHRYYGDSSPFENLTVENLQHLTIKNAIADVTRFAREARLPFDHNHTSTGGGGSSNAPHVPWIYSGGSYSGALGTWIESVDPGTFWAYHVSSAVVQAVDDFWQYFEPVRDGLPKNCSADVARVVEHVDSVLDTATEEDKRALKHRFGLADLQHDDDFVAVLENGPWQWQGKDVSSGYARVDMFCDYIENAYPNVFPQGPLPDDGGVGLEKALTGYARWVREVLLPGSCAEYGYWTTGEDLGCFDMHNFTNPIFRDYSVDNAGNRQWAWFLCNEPLKWWQNGAPEGKPSLVSRRINDKYWEMMCAHYFPPESHPAAGGGVKVSTYGIARGEDVDRVNAFTGGWARPDDDGDRKRNGSRRVVFVNGGLDPWLYATVSSPARPEGPLESTPETPVLTMPAGVHCTDLLARNGLADSGVKEVQDEVVATIKRWVGEFRGDDDDGKGGEDGAW